MLLYIKKLKTSSRVSYKLDSYLHIWQDIYFRKTIYLKYYLYKIFDRDHKFYCNLILSIFIESIFTRI